MCRNGNRDGSPVQRKQDIGIQTEYTGSGHMEGIEDEIRI